MYETIAPMLHHLKAEHERLAKRVSEIECIVHNWTKQRNDQCVRRVREQLSVVEEEISRNLTDEREGGILEDAVSRCPSVANAAATLQTEQGLILKRLHAIQNRIRQKAAESESGDLKVALYDLCQRIRCHEVEVDRVVAQAYGRWVEREHDKAMSF